MATVIARFDKLCDQPKDVDSLILLLYDHGVEFGNTGMLVYAVRKKIKGCEVIDEVAFTHMRIKRSVIGRDTEGKLMVAYIIEPLCQSDYNDCSCE